MGRSLWEPRGEGDPSVRPATMKEGSEGEVAEVATSRDADSTVSNGATLMPPRSGTALANALLGIALAPDVSPRINSTKGALKIDHNRDKVFVCNICNRCFGYKHVLQNHERTHTGEKPFECKECHKRFTRDHHLKTHMRLHTGEKPYHCSHCDRQFVQVANLRRHLRVHTGERPYACTLCSSRFSDSNQLKAHVLIHEGVKPFECEKCSGRFRRRHHLVHHKCPKDAANIGKPRRGRRPKAYDQLQPTSLPILSPVLQERLSAPIPDLSSSQAAALTSVITKNSNSSNSNNSSSSPPQQPPVAHMHQTPLRRNNHLHVPLHLLAQNSNGRYHHLHDSVQTGPLDMTVSSNIPNNSVSVIVPPRMTIPYQPDSSPLDLSNSRSDSEAEPIEEEVDEADLEDDCLDDGLDSDSEDDHHLHMGMPPVRPWGEEDDQDLSIRRSNGEHYCSEGEDSSIALRLTTS